ncbi:hypothetical protein ASF49_19565 [Methylobacterium sp. Leaf104]|uniref:hypothetical protein n=1 Tax=Methylobacterium TaxID=407 RepID=UPI0006F5C02C|nr:MULTISPECIES: hypothetical protein [Methylobacterium]KQP40974.1 hypothetical protein ASF49_19565 [Methylobacterium sp. Leaf104]MCI9880911.1 hypothetical protein [Methylobacterium goesingense]
MPALLPALLPTLLGLAACESSVDRQRALICRRAVPALAPPDTAVRLLRIGAGATPDDVRVDYAVAGRPGQAARQRWVTCRFGPGAELLGLATEGGPVNGARLFLLRQYYLDTPEAAAADPGAEKAPADRAAP